MNILEKTKEIIAKHNIVANSLSFNPFKIRNEKDVGFACHEEFKGVYEKVTELWEKYGKRVGENWYGFDVNEWPLNWLETLDDFLAELEKDSPDFEIHSIKLKYGGARIYLANLSEEAYIAVDLLEEVMQDNNLIY